jgi:hypothetical protein
MANESDCEFHLALTLATASATDKSERQCKCARVTTTETTNCDTETCIRRSPASARAEPCEKSYVAFHP